MSTTLLSRLSLRSVLAISPAVRAGFLLCCSIAHQGSLSAQTTPPAPGERVRVKTAGRPAQTIVGVYRGIRQDSLTVAAGLTGDWTVAVANIARLDVARGRRSATKEGALIGGGVGVALGAVLAAIAAAGDEEGSLCDAGCGFAAGTIFFGGVGVGAGMIIGSLVRVDRWERASADDLSPGLGAFGGLRLGISARF